MNQKLIDIIRNMPGNVPRFASITYKAKGTGELARHRLLLGVRLERAYKRDLAVMRRHLPRTTGIETMACQEIIDSLSESLAVGIGNNSGYTQKGKWENLMPGLRQDVATGAIQVYGFSRGKTVIEPGIYKTVKSSELTIAKNALRKRLKINRFRPFCFEAIQTLRANGNVIEIA